MNTDTGTMPRSGRPKTNTYKPRKASFGVFCTDFTGFMHGAAEHERRYHTMRTVNPTVVCGRTVVCAHAVCGGTGFKSPAPEYPRVSGG